MGRSSSRRTPKRPLPEVSSSLLPSPITKVCRPTMPRRPRPVSREKPGKEGAAKSKLSLPKGEPKPGLKVVDPQLESDEENIDDDENRSFDSDEDEGSDDGSIVNSDKEESDVDVDAPRVAQWVDEEDLEQPEVSPGDASHKKTVNLEDIVRFFCPFLRARRLPYSLQETVQDSKENGAYGEPPLISPL